jgi:hypothetical protein
VAFITLSVVDKAALQLDVPELVYRASLPKHFPINVSVGEGMP